MEYKALKIVKKSELSSKTNVIDLTVDDTHNYVSENGVINHNSGLVYNASITLELSASKLEDKANESAAASRQGADQTTKFGVKVSAKPIKTRFCRPMKVSFQIPYFKSPNPFVGLEMFMNWENAGVCRGNLITVKEYEKMKDAEKAAILPFTYNGETMYCQPKDTARGIVVAHLGKQVPMAEFLSAEVFTQEYLEHLNEKVIKPMFELPDQSAFDDINEIEESLEFAESETTTTNEIENILN